MEILMEYIYIMYIYNYIYIFLYIIYIYIHVYIYIYPCIYPISIDITSIPVNPEWTPGLLIGGNISAAFLKGEPLIFDQAELFIRVLTLYIYIYIYIIYIDTYYPEVEWFVQLWGIKPIKVGWAPSGTV